MTTSPTPNSRDSLTIASDLWLDYSPTRTIFCLWSPEAEAVELRRYQRSDGDETPSIENLTATKNGRWQLTVAGDLNGTYYTYRVKWQGKWLSETPGIYAQAVGVDGERAMVLDHSTTDPTGWDRDRGPAIDNPNDAVIYELHIRDMSINPTAGSSTPGKYLGVIEQGLTGPGGVKMGLDHLKELGITHVHLLPAFDYLSVNERELDRPQFNWGYDPQNYNVPEGSYATDPFDAAVRVREFKQMVAGLHAAGIGVILDVVYNHTGKTAESNFNQEYPDYYYRLRPDGTYSDASACGNETASEKEMVRAYIKESVAYWAREYHLDGFRFDLMGIHDIQTMNEVTEVLETIDPRIFVYGEGWTAGDSPLPEPRRALKKYTHRMPGLSAFSDDIRDGLKGSVFEEESTGFVSGAKKMEESVKFGVVGAIQHDQVDYRAVNYSDTAWAAQPWQSVSYVSCHDNHTLYDKLKISRPDASEADIVAMDLLANTVVLTSQGIAFLHAGVEMLRTKGGEHNSYNLSDEVNRIDWQRKADFPEVFNYYQALIALRKAHPAFRLATAEEVRKRVRFLPTQPSLVAFTIDATGTKDEWKRILVVYNAGTKAHTIEAPGNWQPALRNGKFNDGSPAVKGKVKVERISTFIGYES